MHYDHNAFEKKQKMEVVRSKEQRDYSPGM